MVLKTLLILFLSAVASCNPLQPHVGHDELQLLQVVVLNRHGHRAPNAPYWLWCPQDSSNRNKYDVTPESLTGIGFAEEYNFGKYMKEVYGKFTGTIYNPSAHYVRAVGEPRTIQSANAIAQGMFPDGFGPAGFMPSKSQYVPIFSDLEKHEYLIDDTPCWARQFRDRQLWMSEVGNHILAEPANVALMKKLIKACGADSNLLISQGADMFVKVLIDGVIFNSEIGMRVVNGQLSKDDIFHLRNLSTVLLLGKLYGTDAQKTYVVVDFPFATIAGFDKVLTKVSSFPAQPYHKMEMYCGHREELYGFLVFFGIKVNVPGYPPGEIPTGSSFIFELYLDNTTSVVSKQHLIKTTLWTPDSVMNMVFPGCASQHFCTLDEWKSLYNTRVQRTGTWETLCGGSNA